MTEALARAGICLAESRLLPDWLIRAGMRRVIAARLRQQAATEPEIRERFRRESWAGPIPLASEPSKEQHYEVPPEFFELVLGSRLKYSSAYGLSRSLT